MSPNYVIGCMIGYVVSVLGGHLATRCVMDALWKSLGRTVDKAFRIYPKHPQMAGVLERALYTAAWQLGKPEFIGVWLAVKVAGQWKGWSEPFTDEDSGKKIPGRAFFNLFLIGNAFSIAYALVGGLMIEWISKPLLAPAIGVPIVLGAGTVFFSRWANNSKEGA